MMNNFDTPRALLLESNFTIETPALFGPRSHRLWVTGGKKIELKYEVRRSLYNVAKALGHHFLFPVNASTIFSPYETSSNGIWYCCDAVDKRSLRDYLDNWYAGEYKWSEVEKLLEIADGEFNPDNKITLTKHHTGDSERDTYLTIARTLGWSSDQLLYEAYYGKRVQRGMPLLLGDGVGTGK